MIDVADRHGRTGRGRARSSSGMHRASERSGKRAEAPLAAGEQPVRGRQRGAVAAAPSAADGHDRRGRGRPRRRRGRRGRPGPIRFDDGADEGRHVAADDEDDRFSGGAEAGREPGERALEGDRVVDRASRAPEAATIGVGCGDRRGSRSRPAVTPSMALVRRVRPSRRSASLSRPKRLDRPPARTSPVTRRGVMARPPVACAARGPGTWPAGRSPQDRAPVEVLEDGHHVLAAGPGRVAQRRGGERRVRGEGEGRRGDLVGTWWPRRPGRARGRRSGRSARARGCRRAGSAAARAASASGGGAATERAASRRSIATGEFRILRRARDRRSREPHGRAVPHQERPPSEPVGHDGPATAPRRHARRSSPDVGDPRRQFPKVGELAKPSTAVRTRGDRRPRSTSRRDRDHAVLTLRWCKRSVEIEARLGDGCRVAVLDGRRKPARPVLPSGGDARSRVAARYRGPAPRRSGPHRTTAAGQAVTRCDRERDREPDDRARAPRREARSRPDRLDRRTASAAAVPRCARTRARSGSASRRVGRGSDRSAIRASVVVVRTMPRCRSPISAPAMLSAVRPGWAAPTAPCRGPGSRGRGLTGRPGRVGGSCHLPMDGRGASR